MHAKFLAVALIPLAGTAIIRIWRCYEEKQIQRPSPHAAKPASERLVEGEDAQPEKSTDEQMEDVYTSFVSRHLTMAFLIYPVSSRFYSAQYSAPQEDVCLISVLICRLFQAPHLAFLHAENWTTEKAGSLQAFSDVVLYLSIFTA